MTSNLGSDVILSAGKELSSIGFQHSQVLETKDQEIRTRILGMLREQFRPEFLNRIDEIIVFHSLSEDQMAEIVELQLARLTERLKKERRIEFTVQVAAKKLIAKKGYDPSFGARPLKRTIQTMILNPLSMKLITERSKTEII